jgi:DNA-binding NtrC family response regulator
LVGESAAVMAEIHKIARYAPSNGTVLITGERGTGKGLVANALHRLSRRAAMPFMTLNCGGLHGELLESQLFGHALGAFTGAVSAAPGLFQQANGGTIFLDEMEGMTLPVQIKLLNVLQDKQFRALGSSKLCTVDARIIAATNTNIEEAVKQGRIRADLYDRLNVLRLRMPPLRERIGDVPLLARRFLTRFACDEGKRIDGVTAAAWMKLQAYDWPGNVRDLENVMLRAVLSSQHSNITADDISLATAEVAKSQPYKTRKAANQWAFDEHVVRTALVSSGGNITRAAQAEGMDPRAFRQLVRDHGIPPRAGSGIRFAPNSLEAPPRQSWRHTAGIVP